MARERLAAALCVEREIDMRFYLALWAAKLCAVVIRLIAKDRGTNLPGELALKLDPRFVAHIKGIDPAKAVFITGTNGKSTSTNMIHHVLSRSGCAVSANLMGANLLSGVATALIADCSLGGRFRKEYVVMETDERFLKFIREQLPAKYVCVTNIQRDQCQRNGEPSYIVGRVSQALDDSATLFANADEPNASSLRAFAGRTVTYGVAENARSFDKEDDFFGVGMPCPKCHNPVRFSKYNVANIGPFACTVCGFGGERPDYLAEDIDFEGKTFCVDGVRYAMNFNMPYFVYSYVLAVGVARELGLAEEKIQAAMEAFVNIRGRLENRTLAGKRLHYIKMKQENPETMQSSINLISQDPREKIFMMGFDEYLDFYPPLVISHYLFDCDLRALKRSGVNKCLLMSEAMGRSCAVRFAYDGFEEKDLIALPDNREETLTAVLKDLPGDDVYLVEEIPYFKVRRMA